jgi:beta-N-acetylhexosaminidase
MRLPKLPPRTPAWKRARISARLCSRSNPAGLDSTGDDHQRQRPSHSLSLAVIRLVLALSLLAPAFAFREPFLADYRAFLFNGLLVAATALAAAEIAILATTRSSSRSERVLGFLALAAAASALSSVIAIEIRFQATKFHVLHAEPDELAVLGRHLLVGFRDRSELDELVARRAIAGIFLTSRNVHAMGPTALKAEIRAVQGARQQQGLPPLWIATDQEGGAVSRLSPPLTRLPALSELVASHVDPMERAKAIREFATTQGRELAEIGVNLNFAPVVDLNYGMVNPNDRYTRIYQRAIADDPRLVREVAGEYCAELLATGVHCTLKHFPGLGRVLEDTHQGSAELSSPVSELAATDWIPFRALMDSQTFTMLGHVRLSEIDRDHPASISRLVIAGLIRHDWHHEGVLITDDFGMAAIYGGRDGIKDGAVEALNAGVDLILVSFDPDQYYPVMHALLDALHAGRLRRDLLQASDRRLAIARGG